MAIFIGATVHVFVRRTHRLIANAPPILSDFLIYTPLPLSSTHSQTPDGDDMYLFDQNTLGSMFQFSEDHKEMKLV